MYHDPVVSVPLQVRYIENRAQSTTEKSQLPQNEGLRWLLGDLDTPFVRFNLCAYSAAACATAAISLEAVGDGSLERRVCAVLALVGAALILRLGSYSPPEPVG